MNNHKNDTREISPDFAGITFQPLQVQHLQPSQDLTLERNDQKNKFSSIPAQWTDEDDPAFKFSEMSIRRAFARKVFAILMALLLKTAAYISICVYVEPVKEFLQEYGLWTLIVFPFYIIAWILLICVPPARRTPPWNYLTLLTMSTSLTILVGTACAFYEGETVLVAFGITTVLCLALTLFACQSKFDLTACPMIIFILCLLIPIMGIMAIFWSSDVMQLGLAGLGIIIFSILLIYDIQLIISGSHKYKISPEEHIYAVAMLYVDIINLFIRILRCLR